MNKKRLLSSLMCSLCFTMAAHANTSNSQDAQMKKYQQVCKSKKQGDMVSYSQNGVTFNGTCVSDESGKLMFQPPMPSTDISPQTQSQLSETQSEPRPVSQPMQHNMPTDQPMQDTMPTDSANPMQNAEQTMP